MVNDILTENLSDQSKTKILVVEDDTMIIDMVTQKLKNAGFDVKPVIDGAEAIPAATLYNPKIIILDLMLPNVSGEEILKELAGQTIFGNTKVIVFTNKNREENEENVIGLGADEYLIKASTGLDVLVERIQALAV